MSERLQAYTAAGLLQATLTENARLVELLGTQPSLQVMSGVMSPLDGGTPERHGPAAYDVDDLLLVVAPEDISAPVHAAWNPVVLTSSPYRIEAELPTLPGFDPGRALARPSGPFVLVGRVRVGLADVPDGGADEHAFAWVNRYAVEQVEAGIELFFFFPGAEERLTLGDTPAPPLAVQEAAPADPTPDSTTDPAAPPRDPREALTETGSAAV
jgi:hypothetical protein